jgi:hypothetical protein
MYAGPLDTLLAPRLGRRAAYSVVSDAGVNTFCGDLAPEIRFVDDYFVVIKPPK